MAKKFIVDLDREVKLSVAPYQMVSETRLLLPMRNGISGRYDSERNAAQATIDWRFTIPNARGKLNK